jgi:hypothetical protein
MFHLGEVRCNGIQLQPPVDSRNGEVGFVKPKLAALPPSRRTFGVVVHRI